MKKSITVKQVKNAFKWANDAGLITDASFILGGHPSETLNDIRQTQRLIHEIKPRVLAVCICMPFPGTELNKLMKEKGYIPNESWNHFVYFAKRPPNFRTDYFTYEELRKLQNRILITFCLNPSFIIGKLKRIKNLNELRYWLQVGVSFVKEIVFRQTERKEKQSKSKK